MENHNDFLRAAYAAGRGELTDEELAAFDLEVDDGVSCAYQDLRFCDCPRGLPSLDWDDQQTHQDTCRRKSYLKMVDDLRRAFPEERIRTALAKAGARHGSRYNDTHGNPDDSLRELERRVESAVSYDGNVDRELLRRYVQAWMRVNGSDGLPPVLLEAERVAVEPFLLGAEGGEFGKEQARYVSLMSKAGLDITGEIERQAARLNRLLRAGGRVKVSAETVYVMLVPMFGDGIEVGQDGPSPVGLWWSGNMGIVSVLMSDGTSVLVTSDRRLGIWISSRHDKVPVVFVKWDGDPATPAELWFGISNSVSSDDESRAVYVPELLLEKTQMTYLPDLLRNDRIEHLESITVSGHQLTAFMFRWEVEKVQDIDPQLLQLDEPEHYIDIDAVVAAAVNKANSKRKEMTLTPGDVKVAVRLALEVGRGRGGYSSHEVPPEDARRNIVAVLGISAEGVAQFPGHTRGFVAIVPVSASENDPGMVASGLLSRQTMGGGGAETFSDVRHGLRSVIRRSGGSAKRTSAVLVILDRERKTITISITSFPLSRLDSPVQTVCMGWHMPLVLRSAYARLARTTDKNRITVPIGVAEEWAEGKRENGDESRRSRERHQDLDGVAGEASRISDLMRAGELDPQRVRMAAGLGDEAAVSVLGARPEGWRTWNALNRMLGLGLESMVLRAFNRSYERVRRQYNWLEMGIPSSIVDDPVRFDSILQNIQNDVDEAVHQARFDVSGHLGPLEVTGAFAGLRLAERLRYYMPPDDDHLARIRAQDAAREEAVRQDQDLIDLLLDRPMRQTHDVRQTHTNPDETRRDTERSARASGDPESAFRAAVRAERGDGLATRVDRFVEWSLWRSGEVFRPQNPGAWAHEPHLDRKKIAELVLSVAKLEHGLEEQAAIPGVPAPGYWRPTDDSITAVETSIYVEEFQQIRPCVEERHDEDPCTYDLCAPCLEDCVPPEEGGGCLPYNHKVAAAFVVSNGEEMVLGIKAAPTFFGANAPTDTRMMDDVFGHWWGTGGQSRLRRLTRAMTLDQHDEALNDGLEFQAGTVQVWDNGGRTADRFFILMEGEKPSASGSDESDPDYLVISSSRHPSHPQGIWITHEFGDHEPDAVALEPWTELVPPDVLDAIWSTRGSPLLRESNEVIVRWALLVLGGFFDESAAGNPGEQSDEAPLTAQEIYNIVSEHWKAGVFRHPREIVGPRPQSRKEQWVWDVLESTMSNYGFPEDVERLLRKVSHTCHLDMDVSW